MIFKHVCASNTEFLCNWAGTEAGMPLEEIATSITALSHRCRIALRQIILRSPLYPTPLVCCINVHRDWTVKGEAED